MGTSTGTPLRVVLIEDSPILRDMLRELLDELDGVQVVADADDEAGALAELERHRADLAIVDLELRAHLDQTHETLGVCLDPDKVSSDEARFSVNLTLRISPGANDDADAHTFEALAVVLHCSYTG